MNKVILMGRLVADPEYSESRNNVSVCKFRIAVDRDYAKQGEERQLDFLQIVTFGKTAELVDKYFVKGKPILIEGRIQNNNYEDKDGKMQYHNQIIADSIHFLLSDPTRSSRSRDDDYDRRDDDRRMNRYGDDRDRHRNDSYNDDYRRDSHRDEEDLSGYKDIYLEDDLPF